MRSMEDLTVESLAVVDLVPQPEIYVLGCGPRIQRVPEEIVTFMRSRHIMLEAVDTVNACQIFNVLNQEGRRVIGGIMALSQPE